MATIQTVYTLFDDAYFAIYNSVPNAWECVNIAIDAAYATDDVQLIDAADQLEIFAQEHCVFTDTNEEEITSNYQQFRKLMMDAYAALDCSDQTHALDAVHQAVALAQEIGTTSIIAEAGELETFSKKFIHIEHEEHACDACDIEEEPEDRCIGCEKFHYQCICEDLEKEKECLLDNLYDYLPSIG